jgi:3-phenylpropionate/trans-cinnamate dioxygenase ferredoxin reductase subunit
MPDYKYLIIGGGMTAEAAIRGIRGVDADGSIGVIGSEGNPFYNRPPLSKGLWKGAPLSKVWRAPSGVAASVHLAREAKSIDASKRQVIDDKDTTYTYEKLLLATGGRPRKLPFGSDDINYFRTLEDYHRLAKASAPGKEFAVIGGGFIGSEVAAALAMARARVTMLFPEDGIGARIYPGDLALFLNRFYAEKGVEVRPGVSVNGMEKRGERFVVETDGAPLEVDGVVAGIGIQPNVELAEAIGLAIENGIVVDANLCTRDPNIYAAGDVAAFDNPALGKRMRVEHEDNANTMGEIAGQNMAGKAVPYDHLPFFYSDMFELGYEAVGELDSRLETVADWKDEFRKGVVYYLQDSRVRGVLLWDTWDQVDAARALIARTGPVEPEELKGSI